MVHNFFFHFMNFHKLMLNNLVTIDWSWTWVTGSKNTNGNYGTMGVPSPSNEPPSRSNGGMWVQSNNTVYIFGGFLRVTGFSDGTFLL